MKVAVDVDGVLLDLMVEYCEVFNEKYGTDYEKEDVAHWEFYHDWNISEEAAWEIFHRIYKNSHKIPFIDKNAHKVLKLLNKNHHVDIVSARTFKFKAELRKALKNHGIFKNFHYNSLVLVENKPYDVKLNLDYDIYIDDNPNLVYPIQKTLDKTLLLYSQPWNENSKTSENILRVENWEEICNFFKKFNY
jgi:uncharacterized HAD superfamily protein